MPKRSLEPQRLRSGRTRTGTLFETISQPLDTAAKGVVRDADGSREPSPVVYLRLSFSDVILKHERPALVRKACQAPLEAVVQRLARLRQRWDAKIGQIRVDLSR